MMNISNNFNDLWKHHYFLHQTLNNLLLNLHFSLVVCQYFSYCLCGHIHYLILSFSRYLNFSSNLLDDFLCKIFLNLINYFFNLLPTNLHLNGHLPCYLNLFDMLNDIAFDSFFTNWYINWDLFIVNQIDQSWHLDQLRCCNYLVYMNFNNFLMNLMYNLLLLQYDFFWNLFYSKNLNKPITDDLNNMWNILIDNFFNRNLFDDLVKHCFFNNDLLDH